MYVYSLRFAGDEFPPYIVFKIFIQTNGQGMKYLCGKKVIKSSITVSLSYSEDLFKMKVATSFLIMVNTECLVCIF